MITTVEEARAAIAALDDPYLRAIREQGAQTWGLNDMKRLLKKMGRPQDAYPVIHVAGTKGKGSTCAFITQCLIESGLKVGLYTSPHLQDWRERIQINREWIEPNDLVALINDFQPYLDDNPMTQFEATTALAFWHFARQDVDIAVIEVGLGGRLDATNVMTPIVSVITSISKDHTQLLGDTLEEIAADKGAIIKAGRPAVIAPQHTAAERAIRQRVRKQESPATFVGRGWDYKVLDARWDGSTMEVGRKKKQKIVVDVGMPGEVQCENAAVALAVLGYAEQAGIPVSRRGRIDGLKNAHWPGRLEVMQREPMVLLDGAHNPFSIRKLMHAIRTLDGGSARRGKLHILFGCMADKDIPRMIDAILPDAESVTFVQTVHARAADVDTLKEIAMVTKKGDRPILYTAADFQEGLRLALVQLEPDDTLLITGSLSVVGVARAYLMDQS